jgi:hypothetical protein
MPKVLPVLTNNDTGEAHPIRQYPFPQRGVPTTLLINGAEVEGRMTAWRDLRYTYFTLDGGQYFVAGHLDDAPAYTFTAPEGFTPSQFKKDREAMAARAAELRAIKAADAPAAPAAPEATDEQPKPKRKRKVADAEAAQA